MDEFPSEPGDHILILNGVQVLCGKGRYTDGILALWRDFLEGHSYRWCPETSPIDWCSDVGFQEVAAHLCISEAATDAAFMEWLTNKLGGQLRLFDQNHKE